MKPLLRALAWIATAALLAVPPAAAEQPFPIPTATATETASAGPPPSVRVIQVPHTVGHEALSRLAAALQSRRYDGLVALVPESARLEPGRDARQFAAARKALAAAAENATFDVVQQPDGDGGGDAAAELDRYAAHYHRLDGAPCDTECVDLALVALERSGDEPAVGDEGETLLRSAITAPVPTTEPDGGIGLPAVALAVVLLALAAVLTGILISRMRTPPVTPPEPGPKLPSPPPRPERRVPPASPGRDAHPSRAQVVSVLDPEGYVELERCLRRAGWAGDGPPPNPGDWVEIHQSNGRLWAFPPKSRTRSTARA